MANAKKHYRVAQKEIYCDSDCCEDMEDGYVVNNHAAAIIVGIVFLALIGAFIKGIIVGRIWGKHE
jgi:hypothetical protein